MHYDKLFSHLIIDNKPAHHAPINAHNSTMVARPVGTTFRVRVLSRGHGRGGPPYKISTALLHRLIEKPTLLGQGPITTGLARTLGGTPDPINFFRPLDHRVIHPTAHTFFFFLFPYYSVVVVFSRNIRVRTSSALDTSRIL